MYEAGNKSKTSILKGTRDIVWITLATPEVKGGLSQRTVGGPGKLAAVAQNLLFVCLFYGRAWKSDGATEVYC